MAFIPTAATAKVGVNATINGEKCTITLWFEAALDFGIGDLIDLGNAVIDWATNSLGALLSTGVLFDSVDVVAQDSASAPSVTIPIAGSITGGVASAVLPMQVAQVVTFRTDNRGRSFRGRNYVYGIPTSAEVSAGNASATFISNLALAYADIQDIETLLDVTHVVVSHYADKAARTAGVTTPVTSYSVDQPMDTQRRRSAGRGT